MTNDSIRYLLVPSTAALTYGVYRLLRALVDLAPRRISRLGTASGTAVARGMRSSRYLWFKCHLPLAAATYVLFVGLLISFGTVTPEAVIIGCPVAAIAVSYLVNHFRQQP